MTLQTKTITGSTSSNWIFETVVTENSTSIENNTSSVTVEHFLSHHYAGSYLAGSCTVKWNCNGQEESETKTINSGSLSSYQKFSLGSRTFTVSHNSDGKKTVSVGGSMSTTQFNPNSASASGSIELTTIPRASDIAVSNTDLGQNIPITIGKKVDTFTSTLTYTIGTLTGTIVEKTSLSNYPWVMSTTLINQIKNAYPNTGSYAKGGVEAKVTCKTYNGTTLIGSKDATFKLYITDKPVISSATRTELNTKISALTTNVLRHASKNKFTVSAIAPAGASITGYRVKNGTQDSGLSTSNVVNLNDIQTYYTESNVLKTKFVVTCVDSRGNESEEFPVVCNFTNYIQVSINKTDVTIKRSSGTSSDCKIYATGNFFNGKIGTTDNTIAFKVRTKLKTDTTWGSWTTVSTTYTDNTFKVNNVAISATFDYTKNYDIELMATDKIGESDDYSKVFVSSVPTEKHHSKGAWIRELSFEKADIFPVGAIYISLTSTNPSKYFNGTWEQLKGKFLVGVDTSDVDFNTSGKTGGEKEHTLTISEMPKHSHSIVISSGGSKTTSGFDYTYSSSTKVYSMDDDDMIKMSGESQPHNNLPPYIAVFMWKRIS